MADNDLHYNGGGAIGTGASAAGNGAIGTGASASDTQNSGTEVSTSVPAAPSKGPDYGLTPPRPPYPPENDKDDSSSSDSSSSDWSPSWGNRPQNGPQWMPVWPLYPSYSIPTTANYSQARFLNASTSQLTVNISIDGSAYVSDSKFGSLSDYDWVSDGFHTVTIRSASGLKNVLLQQTFPFTAGQKATFVLTDAQSGGLSLVRIVDSGCSNLPTGSGCFRFGNMTWPGSRLDLMLGSETVFSDIAYQNVSSYKQAVAGTYQFTAVTAANYAFIRELPVIIIGGTGTSVTGRETILTFTAAIASGKDYTAYLIGNSWSGANLQVVLAED